MYKLIACDLDETLISLDRTISKANIEAINKATALGIKFVLATGRGYKTVEGTLKELDLFNKDNEYVISFNGSAITCNKDNKLLYIESLDYSKANELYQRGLNYDVCMHVYTKDDVYAYNLWQEEIDYLQNRMPIIEIFNKDLDFLKNEEIIKVIYTNTNYNYLKSIENDLKAILDDITVSYSSNRYIEFNKKGIDKGYGLSKLAKLLNIPIDQTIAIGDNLNDLAMIKAAGLGVAVQNGKPELKEYADYITKANCNESAIAEVINKFILKV